MIEVIAITEENEIVTDISLNSLNDINYRWLWVDFNQPTDLEMSELDKTFHFHPLAIEDCIYKLQRPKLDYYDDYTFFVVHSLRSRDLDKEEVNMFVGQNYIVTFHHEPSIEIAYVRGILKNVKDISKWDQYRMLYHIIDKLVDNYFPILYEIEDNINNIEYNPERKVSVENVLEQLFEIRSYLLTLRHTVLPTRDLLYRMLNSHHLKVIRERKEYFADIHDHLLKLTEMIESNREITNDIRDSYLSLNSHQTNRIMKVLTVITVIFMPLTFIAGVYGMNFELMPELKWDYGYFVTLGIMGGIGFGMFFWFRYKGWFK